MILKTEFWESSAMRTALNIFKIYLLFFLSLLTSSCVQLAKIKFDNLMKFFHCQMQFTICCYLKIYFFVMKYFIIKKLIWNSHYIWIIWEQLVIFFKKMFQMQNYKNISTCYIIKQITVASLEKYFWHLVIPQTQF